MPSIVTEVAARVFFADAEPCDRARFEELSRLLPSDGRHDARASDAWLVAHVRFRGLIAGLLEVRMPEVLAQDLCAALAGSEAREFSEPELLDTVGELGNILCGALLTRAARERRFELLPPQVARTDVVADDAPASGPGETVLPVCVNDYPALVRLTISRV